MRPFYQTEWQNIQFSSFAEISSTKIANAEFYDAFYQALFEKYPDYDALDPAWRRNKDETADWLATLLPDGARVLSVGCGLGYMEQRLWRKHGDRIDLHVQDYASESLRWLRQVMPPEQIHDDAVEGGRGKTRAERYDLIYLSAVDYALADDELIVLLAGIRDSLRENGHIVMISASFWNETGWQSFIRSSKNTVKWFLDSLGLRKRGQLWGWMRSRDEYQAIMGAAGLVSVTDDFVVTPHQRTYWIKGSGVAKA